jgi:antitoxin component YwqK of YwqJK toxin-antitoxin module/peroxiredoxin
MTSALGDGRWWRPSIHATILRRPPVAGSPVRQENLMNTKPLCLGLAICLSLGACKFLVKQIVDHTESWASGLPKSRGALDGGTQTGEWTFYYESGKPRAKGTYANDRQIGAWTYYYEGGTAERTGSYDADGKRTGEWTFQHPDQTPQARGCYVADFEDGPWFYYGTNGLLEREGQYDAGKQSGPWNHYYGDGKPKASGMYFRGQRLGQWIVWDEAGNRGVQDFGGRPGVELVRELDASGKLRREGVLLEGKPVGRWSIYHETGKRQFCCTLNGAVLSGIYELGDANGNPLAFGLWSGSVPGGDGPALEAELTRPVDRTRLAPAEAPTALVAPKPAVEAVVAAVTAEPSRMPAPAQPDLTVKQRQEMKSYVEEYISGPARNGSMFDKYRPAGAPARPVGQGEQTQWYGKSLPFDVIKGVDGTDLDLRQFQGKRKVMIVVLRGFLGEVCCYCIAQTKALAQSRERLEQLGIEVLVIYPGARENEASFEKAYKMTFNEGGPPYRVFYDPDLDLVKSLGIDGDLASPSTLIVDQAGKIQFFYKGEHRADRPAAKRLLQKIEEMQQ